MRRGEASGGEVTASPRRCLVLLVGLGGVLTTRWERDGAVEREQERRIITSATVLKLFMYT